MLKQSNVACKEDTQIHEQIHRGILIVERPFCSYKCMEFEGKKKEKKKKKTLPKAIKTTAETRVCHFYTIKPVLTHKEW